MLTISPLLIIYGVVYSTFQMSDDDSKLEDNEVAKIQKEILNLLKGQTFGDSKEILNFTLDSLEYNSIVQKDIL